MKKLSILALVLTFFVVSCEEKEVETTAFQEETLLIPSTASASSEGALRQNVDALGDLTAITNADAFAKMLASSLKDKDIRKFLKEEANKQFDGDYDILVSNALSQKVGTQAFEDKIKAKTTDGIQASTQILQQAKQNKLLNIAIPILIDKWNWETQIPLVAVAVGVSEKATKLLVAYDSNGKKYAIDTNKEPNVPVIVIANSERVDDNGRVKLAFTKSKNLRPANSPEYIYSMRTNDLGQMESWIYGKPEIKCHIAGVRNGTNISPIWIGYWVPNRPSINNADYVVDNFTFTWTPDYGNYVTYTWVEEDFSGGEVDIDVPLKYQSTFGGVTSTYSMTIKRKIEDKVIAQNQIWKGESSMQQYYGGYTFSFKLKFVE